MKLGWYVNRLRSMQPAEVLHRLREKRRQLAARGRREGWARYAAGDLHSVLPGLRAALVAANPQQRRAIQAAAEDFLAGNFAALGVRWPQRDPADLFPAELWRLDPVSGRLWPGPETYAFAIDFRHDGERGDIKYVWEINRLQMLPVLAAHLVLTGDECARAAIDMAIASWHAANPPFRGVGWASGIEVALRAISLIAAADIAGDRIDAPTRRRIGEILAASIWFLARFPSRYSSANNHLVAELAGRYLISLALGRTDAVARSELIVEIDRQILADGAGAEQSPTYSAFTAELALLCALAGRDAGDPFPAAFAERLAAFAEFVDWLGPATARFGDDDEGRVFACGSETDYPRSVASAICGFLGRPGLAPESDDCRTLLFGAPTSVLPAPAGLRSFSEGGVSVWHGSIGSRSVDLAFDHGPLGYLSIAAHGHADALSLALAIDGVPVLVDPGTFLYGSGGKWRDWFRSTPAHSTLNIDGTSQSTMTGAFNWSHKAKASLLNGRNGPEWSLRASHDGYQRRFNCVHQRTIERAGDGIAVTDQLIGTARTAEIVFQLAPGHHAEIDGPVATILRDGEPILAIRFPDATITCTAGGDIPGVGGWVSPRFGSRIPAERLAWCGLVAADGVTCRLLPLSP